MLIKILIALVVLVGIFLVIVSRQPETYRTTRSTTISAPAAVVFSHVNDFHKWEAWNPWGKLDPNVKNTYTGPASGKDASVAWVGNKNVGEGKMTIIESRPSELIGIGMDFYKPFAAKANAEFTFKPQGNQTLVTWSMFGKNNFMGRAMCLVMNSDKMIGGQFEKGLADLKAIAEARAK